MSGRGRRRWRRLTSSHTHAETLLRVGEDARHNIGKPLGKGRAHEDAALLEPCPTGAAFVQGVDAVQFVDREGRRATILPPRQDETLSRSHPPGDGVPVIFDHLVHPWTGAAQPLTLTL